LAEPHAVSLAKAFDRIWEDRAAAKRWGEAGRALYETMNITWDHVVQKLLA